MYSLDQVRKGLTDPGMALQELNRWYYAARNDGGYHDRGVDIFGADWDNLVILDACRYDEFAARADLPGTLEKRRSRASMTHEWVRANFEGKQLHDVVYVSASGRFLHAQQDLNAEVHEFVSLIDQSEAYGEAKVCPPDVVTDRALEAAHEHPDKRLIVHYLQPHMPYLGPSGETFEYHSSLDESVRRSSVSDEALRRAYRENLDMVLDDVSKLFEQLQGKTAVTSDHGELLGERERPLPVKRYGHPSGIYVPELVEVPWHIYTNGGRKEVVAEPPEAELEYDEEAIKDHLKDIGYAV
ncbi:hypothetical protein I7X12_18485 [Halosimplex litoreum]|uniref:Sulfatase N-terminal domain-containing protein n=1 Tax=Halosimplex litoreum TaxID=1198301 RepID=A0A7T3FXN5_9EURY|nr:hypothetical protein [Halosimplex litoreum]QPV62689.1 hypothetical protein I7X12_18485 [Halosimplex litoreum]